MKRCTLRWTGAARLFLFMGVMLLAVPAQSWSAESLGRAAVSGVVSDNAGDAIPGVTVTATRGGEQSHSSLAVSDGGGAFRIGELRPAGRSERDRHRDRSACDLHQSIGHHLPADSGHGGVPLSLVPLFRSPASSRCRGAILFTSRSLSLYFLAAAASGPDRRATAGSCRGCEGGIRG